MDLTEIVKSLKVFISYAHKDESLLQELEKQLSVLKNQDLISVWHDREISAGKEWKREIENNLKEAQIILLLISPDFINSAYCYSIEMAQALERHRLGEARVIPVIIRPTTWEETPLGELQALPTGGKPVIDPYWHTMDYAFLDIASGIRKVIAEIRNSITGHNLLSNLEQTNKIGPPEYTPWNLSPDSGDRSVYERMSSLTSRERELLSLLAKGLTYEAIGKRLYKSYASLRNMTRMICETLNVDSKEEAIKLVMKYGLETEGAYTFPLSLRESEVLRLMVKGCENVEIAKELSISEKTVKSHIYRITQKLQVSDRKHAIARAQKLGLE